MLSKYIISLYWLNQLGGNKEKQWNTLSHNGVIFYPDYEPINIPILYDGKEVYLNKEAEEVATFYAKFLDTEYIKNPKFNKNFWKDFKTIIDKNLNIIDFEKIDFSLIKKFLENQKANKNELSKEEKEEKKKIQDKTEEKYKYAIIDGKQQPVGNYKIEPPSIFLGRGCHPKIGRIKKRINPKDIIINIGKDAPIPDTGINEKNWGDIIHDDSVIWLASWKENVTGKTKYVRLSDKSDYKAKSDESKFDLARKLKRKFGDIRKENERNLISDDPKIRQLATALYLIENLALRIGNEKGKDEADTVGVTSLRVEHINLLENNKVKLDFLGKDSIRYTNKFEVIDLIFRNLHFFIEGKEKKNSLFPLINASDLNKYIQNFMNGLTSKVFRTMNASKLFQKELNKITSKYESYGSDDKINFILDEFNKANAKVAMLCNHQKNVNKGFKDQLKNINDKLKKLSKQKKLLEEKKIEYKEKGKDTKSIRERIKKLEEKVKILKSKKNLKVELKNVSLGTSKINYIDPRITVSFMKKNNIPIDKLFNESLQEKFKWAMNVDINFNF
jgi:DNA topoisomerase-1